MPNIPTLPLYPAINTDGGLGLVCCTASRQGADVSCKDNRYTSLYQICPRLFETRPKVLIINGFYGNKGFHTGRRTFATLLERAGLSEVVQQSMLGHSNFSMTRGYIKTETIEHIQKVNEALNKNFV